MNKLSSTENQAIRRSLLYVPANRADFLEKAWRRGADAIILDLEDSIAPAEKKNARSCLIDGIELASKGGGDVFVRVNSEPELLDDDLEACIHPGLCGIVVPKVESAEQLSYIENTISRLEKERQMEEGSIETYLIFETAKGFVNMEKVLSVNTRGKSMSLGTEDFTTDLGMKLTDGMELLYPKFHTVIVARAYGVKPYGLIGSTANFNDLDAFYTLARKSYLFGCTGTTCIHPKQVSIANKAYAPTEEEVAYARRVVAVFEEAKANGRASVGLDGEMVDTPVALRAEKVLRVQAAIDRLEERKKQAMEKVGDII